MVAGHVFRFPLPKPALKSLARYAQFLRNLLNLEELLVTDLDRHESHLRWDEYI